MVDVQDLEVTIALAHLKKDNNRQGGIINDDGMLKELAASAFRDNNDLYDSLKSHRTLFVSVFPFSIEMETELELPIVVAADGRTLIQISVELTESYRNVIQLRTMKT